MQLLTGCMPAQQLTSSNALSFGSAIESIMLCNRPTDRPIDVHAKNATFSSLYSFANITCWYFLYLLTTKYCQLQLSLIAIDDDQFSDWIHELKVLVAFDGFISSPVLLLAKHCILVYVDYVWVYVSLEALDGQWTVSNLLYIGTWCIVLALGFSYYMIHKNVDVRKNVVFTKY